MASISVIFSLFLYEALRNIIETNLKSISALAEIICTVSQSLDNELSQRTLFPNKNRGTMENLLRILKQQDGEVTAFSEKLRCSLSEYATAHADDRLTFAFKKKLRL